MTIRCFSSSRPASAASQTYERQPRPASGSVASAPLQRKLLALLWLRNTERSLSSPAGGEWGRRVACSRRAGGGLLVLFCVVRGACVACAASAVVIRSARAAPSPSSTGAAHPSSIPLWATPKRPSVSSASPWPPPRFPSAKACIADVVVASFYPRRHIVAAGVGWVMWWHRGAGGRPVSIDPSHPNISPSQSQHAATRSSRRTQAP